jgi:hypothetical protein
MSDQDDAPDREESQDRDESDDRDDARDEQRERAFDLNDPEVEPGVTARLDHVTEEEEKSGPMGMMAGSGPDPDDVPHSGVEAQEARQRQEEGPTDSGEGEGDEPGERS